MGIKNGDQFIRLDNLWKQFQEGGQKREVLRGTGAAFERGEFVAILGKSGSGKSTLLNLISGIDWPDQGAVRINGQTLTQLDENQRTLFRRQHIGFIFQFFNLIPSLTARENVEFAAELVAEPMDSLEMLDIVGLKERADHYPSELSGGEQQRVAIARALVKDPTILMGDEPTGDLDYDTGKNILAAMRRINRERHKTVLVVTHNASIAEMADRVIRMRSGEIVEVKENPNPIDPKELKW